MPTPPDAARTRLITDILVTSFTVAAGLFAGWVDFHNDEVQAAVLVVLVGSGLAGLAQPAHAWRWAVIVALGIPAVYLIGDAIGATPVSPPGPNLFGTLMALIPGFIGAYAGALARRAAGALL